LFSLRHPAVGIVKKQKNGAPPNARPSFFGEVEPEIRAYSRDEKVKASHPPEPNQCEQEVRSREFPAGREKSRELKTIPIQTCKILPKIRKFCVRAGN
jgi:hypothetical protein